MPHVIGHLLEDGATVGWVITPTPNPPTVIGKQVFKTKREAQNALHVGIRPGYTQYCTCRNTVKSYAVFAFYPHLGIYGEAAWWEVIACLDCEALVIKDEEASVPIDNIRNAEDLANAPLESGDRIHLDGPYSGPYLRLPAVAEYVDPAPNDSGIVIYAENRLYQLSWKKDITHLCQIPKI